MQRMCRGLMASVPVALMLGLIGYVGFADAYTVGVEIIPHGGVGIQYLTIGYDADWLVAYFGTNNPGTANAWYTLHGGLALSVSPMFRIMGGPSLWANVVDFTSGSAWWTWWVGGNFRLIQKPIGEWGVEASLFIKANFPSVIDPNAFLLGTWFSVGLTVGFAPPVLGPSK